jgi:hypothetical protein
MQNNNKKTLKYGGKTSATFTHCMKMSDQCFRGMSHFHLQGKNAVSSICRPFKLLEKKRDTLGHKHQLLRTIIILTLQIEASFFPEMSTT